MTSVWDELAPDALGKRLADDLRTIVLAYENQRDRTQQTEIGPSGLGNPCTRCLAREVLGVPIERVTDPWCAIIGTAVHTWLSEAAIFDSPDRWLVEGRVYPDPTRELLPVGGSADLYDAETKTVVDHKVVGLSPLRKYRANGPTVGYRRQVHLYGLGYVLAGEPVENVAIAFWHRGGRLSDLYVWTEPYDVDLAVEALKRYRTVRELALASGVAILLSLPVDPDCWDCGGDPDRVGPEANPTRKETA